MANWIQASNGNFLNLDMLTQLQIQQTPDGKYNLTYWGLVVRGPFDTENAAIEASNTLLSASA